MPVTNDSDLNASVSSLCRRSRFATVCSNRSLPASNVVGLAVPSDALTVFSMLNWNEFVPRVRLASTVQLPFRRTPTVTALSSMSEWISGRKPNR